MRFKHSLAAGLVLAMPIMLTGTPAQADGPLKRHLHGDCPAEQSVVRLPAQEIRIETTRPRVVVNQMSSHSRARGFFPAGQAFIPMASGPFVAHFPAGMTFQAATFGASSSPGSSALDAVHALERQHLEFTKRQSELQAEMNLVSKVQQRVLGNISASAAPSNATSPDTAQLKTAIENLSKRIGDIEQLLLIHDDWIKKNKK